MRVNEAGESILVSMDASLTMWRTPARWEASMTLPCNSTGAVGRGHKIHALHTAQGGFERRRLGQVALDEFDGRSRQIRGLLQVADEKPSLWPLWRRVV